jgi:RimJ/RimL family protein N-acetyltransferase
MGNALPPPPSQSRDWSSHGRAIGYVRFEIVKELARISVSIERKERGKGRGRSAIRMASDRLLESEHVKRIVAHVRKDNPLSLAAFQHAGFIITGTRPIMGIEALEMTYTREQTKTEWK